MGAPTHFSGCSCKVLSPHEDLRVVEGQYPATETPLETAWTLWCPGRRRNLPDVAPFAMARNPTIARVDLLSSMDRENHPDCPDLMNPLFAVLVLRELPQQQHIGGLQRRRLASQVRQEDQRPQGERAVHAGSAAAGQFQYH